MNLEKEKNFFETKVIVYQTELGLIPELAAI